MDQTPACTMCVDLDMAWIKAIADAAGVDLNRLDYEPDLDSPNPERDLAVTIVAGLKRCYEDLFLAQFGIKE